MENEEKIPEINLQIKSVYVEPKTIKLKTIYKYFLDVNNQILMTDNIFIYYWYKIWWKIKPPPELRCYYGVDAEKDLITLIENEIKYFTE